MLGSAHAPGEAPQEARSSAAARSISAASGGRGSSDGLAPRRAGEGRARRRSPPLLRGAQLGASPLTVRKRLASVREPALTQRAREAAAPPSAGTGKATRRGPGAPTCWRQPTASGSPPPAAPLSGWEGAGFQQLLLLRLTVSIGTYHPGAIDSSEYAPNPPGQLR